MIATLLIFNDNNKSSHCIENFPQVSESFVGLMLKFVDLRKVVCQFVRHGHISIIIVEGFSHC